MPMNEDEAQKAVEIYVGMARDLRTLREVATIALVLLGLAIVFAVVVYQRHALAAAAAAVKG